jgi:hypothetical protein
VARNNDILKKLVLEAKRDYEKDAIHRVHIFMADTYGLAFRGCLLIDLPVFVVATLAGAGAALVKSGP